jgi:hypothetical protein
VQPGRGPRWPPCTLMWASGSQLQGTAPLRVEYWMLYRHRPLKGVNKRVHCVMSVLLFVHAASSTQCFIVHAGKHPTPPPHPLTLQAVSACGLAVLTLAAGWAPPPCSSPATCTSCHLASCQSTAWQPRRQAALCPYPRSTPRARPTHPSSLCTAPSSMPGWCSSTWHTRQCLAAQQQQQGLVLLLVAAVGAGPAATSHWCRMQQQRARGPGFCQVGEHNRI